MRILTITLNPALDAFTSAPKVEPVHKLRCGAPQFHPGGGGINVARVIHRLGGDVLALFPVGGLAGQHLCQLLTAEAVATRCLPIAGETRETFKLAPFLYAAARERRITGEHHRGEWTDVGTPERLAELDARIRSA